MSEKKLVFKAHDEETALPSVSECFSSPEEELVSLLKKNDLSLTTAESCTGGLIASNVVSVPGASAVFKEGFVVYSGKAKRKTLDVSKSTIKKYGTISPQVAKEMAMGAALYADADLAVSVTGNAGPEAEEEKPVGLVYIGICLKEKLRLYEFMFEGERNEIREQVAKTAVLLCLKAARKWEQKNG